MNYSKRVTYQEKKGGNTDKELWSMSLYSRFIRIQEASDIKQV